MATTTLVLIRVDKNVKADATKTLAAIGASDAVRMLLVRVATEKALSIEVKVPDATTVKARQEAACGAQKRFESAGAPFKNPGI
jgi:DNA-damage-inducible protein J